MDHAALHLMGPALLQEEKIKHLDYTCSVHLILKALIKTDRPSSLLQCSLLFLEKFDPVADFSSILLLWYVLKKKKKKKKKKK